MPNQNNECDEKNRSITDADAEAIAYAFRKQLKQEFYNDLGQGVWALVWRGVVFALLFIAAYGAAKGVSH